MSPIITAILAACLLKDERLSIRGYIALLIAVSGLTIMYDVAAEFGDKAILGLIGIVASTWLHGLSAVLAKRANADISPMSATAGSVLASLPLFALACLLSDQPWLPQVSERGLAAIIYTGVIATALGFSLYYFVLKKLSAIRVSLISLFSPMLALWLGHMLNHEPITGEIVLGSGLILSALMFFQGCGGKIRVGDSG